MRTTVLGLLCFFAASALLPAPTRAQSVALGVKAGSNGPGVRLITRLGSSVNLRVDGSYFAYSTDGTETVEGRDAAWTADGDLMFASGILDWFPFGGGFHLSAGAVYNGLTGNGTIRLAEPVQVQNRSYTPDEVGDLDVDVSFGSSIAPYAGLGFGNALGRRVGVQLDLGVMRIGNPSIDLTGTGMIAPTAGEAQKIEDNLDWIQWYPVVSLGLSVRLF